eukprot:Rhum_TRINITY_DN4511_c0_g2::Rhum_TRINITY_DN4511_c0_g2_i1::g.14731::m.14731
MCSDASSSAALFFSSAPATCSTIALNSRTTVWHTITYFPAMYLCRTGSTAARRSSVACWFSTLWSGKVKPLLPLVKSEVSANIAVMSRFTRFTYTGSMAGCKPRCIESHGSSSSPSPSLSESMPAPSSSASSPITFSRTHTCTCLFTAPGSSRSASTCTRVCCTASRTRSTIASVTSGAVSTMKHEGRPKFTSVSHATTDMSSATSTMLFSPKRCVPRSECVNCAHVVVFTLTQFEPFPHTTSTSTFTVRSSLVNIRFTATMPCTPDRSTSNVPLYTPRLLLCNLCAVFSGAAPSFAHEARKLCSANTFFSRRGMFSTPLTLSRCVSRMPLVHTPVLLASSACVRSLETSAAVSSVRRRACAQTSAPVLAASPVSLLFRDMVALDKTRAPCQ